MSLHERFGELRSVMHTPQVKPWQNLDPHQLRWKRVCELLARWPDARHLQETVIPYLRELFAHDGGMERVAPASWWAWGPDDAFVPKHPALSLATGITWEVPMVKMFSAPARLSRLSDAGIVCHALRWDGSWEPCLDLLHLGSAPLARLTTFNIDNKELNAAGLTALLRAPQRNTLTTFGVRRAWLSGDVSALVNEPPLPQLTTLHFSHNWIEDAGAIAIASAPRFATLTTLNLEINGIGDAGAKALAQSPHLANLTGLHLDHNAFGDEGAQALASSPYLNEVIRRHWAQAILRKQERRKK